MKLIIASDHCGYALKNTMIPFIKNNGWEYVDVGCFSEDPVDFPDVIQSACQQISKGECERAIVFCGTGVGAAIAGNKTKGIRAAVCHDTYSAHQAVEHDNVNMLCLGGKIVSEWLAEDLITAFIDAEFSKNEDFRRRVAKLERMDKSY